MTSLSVIKLHKQSLLVLTLVLKWLKCAFKFIADSVKKTGFTQAAQLYHRCYQTHLYWGTSPSINVKNISHISKTFIWIYKATNYNPDIKMFSTLWGNDLKYNIISGFYLKVFGMETQYGLERNSKMVTYRVLSEIHT